MATSSGYQFEDLINFYDFARRDRNMARALSYARKSSCRKIYPYLTDDEKADVRKINLDKVIERISKLNGADLTPDKLKAHQGQVRKAIEEFLAYKQDPEGWEPASKQPTEQDKQEIREALATYQFPMRPNLIVTLEGLPLDMTRREAQRLSDFIGTLALVDDTKEEE